MKEKFRLEITFYVILVFLASCSNGDRSTKELKSQPVQLDGLQRMTYYPSGKLKTKTTYNQYFQKQGLREDYYEGGQIETRCNYNKDTLEGPFESFNPNGSVKLKALVWKGRKIGPTYYYDGLGKLQLYNEVDFDRGIYYVIKYDKDQKIIKEEGVSISPVFLINSRMTDTLPMSGNAEINFFYAEPEGYKNVLQCFINGNLVECRRQNGHLGSIDLGVSAHNNYELKITSTLMNASQSVMASDSIVKTVRSF